MRLDADTWLSLLQPEARAAVLSLLRTLQLRHAQGMFANSRICGLGMEQIVHFSHNASFLGLYFLPNRWSVCHFSLRLIKSLWPLSDEGGGRCSSVIAGSFKYRCIVT